MQMLLYKKHCSFHKQHSGSFLCALLPVRVISAASNVISAASYIVSAASHNISAAYPGTEEEERVTCFLLVII